MNKDTKTALSEFSRRAMQRLEDKKLTKTRTLYIPSLDDIITIRNLRYAEIADTANMDSDSDPNRGDKYVIYQGVQTPNLQTAAKQIMQEEASLAPEERMLHEPLDIVDMFDIAEIHEIAMEIMRLSGVVSDKKVTVVDALKN